MSYHTKDPFAEPQRAQRRAKNKLNPKELEKRGIDIKQESPDILKNNIIPPATKFQVLEGDIRDGTFLPETLGFISYWKPSGNGSNIAAYQTVVLRRGKSGRPRLDWNTILTPYYHEQNSITRLMGIDCQYNVIMEPISIEQNILKMTDADFLGWIVSKNLYLHNLATNGYSKNPSNSPWPQSKTHILNRLRNLIRAFGNDPDHVREEFRHASKRVECITALREMESILLHSSTIYNMEIIKRRKSALMNLEKKADKWDYLTISKECIKNTLTELIEEEKF